MKIEGETIVIRVGGGFLTFQEFVALNCGAEDEQQRKKITNLVYAGKCAGNREFKTFHMEQVMLDETDEAHQSEITVERKSRTPNASKRPSIKTVPQTPNQKTNIYEGFN